MRLLGLLILVLGSAGTVASVARLFQERRPRDIMWSLIAPVALALALLGVLIVFVPDFVS